MEQNERTYTLEELRGLPVGTQVLVKTEAYGKLWVSLGRFCAEGIIPNDQALTFYAGNGLCRMSFGYKDYGDDSGWVALKPE